MTELLGLWSSSNLKMHAVFKTSKPCPDGRLDSTWIDRKSSRNTFFFTRKPTSFLFYSFALFKGSMSSICVALTSTESINILAFDPGVGNCSIRTVVRTLPYLVDWILSFDCLFLLVLWGRNLKSKLFLFLTIWVAFILSSISPSKPKLYVVDKTWWELICMGVYVTCIKSRNVIERTWERCVTSCEFGSFWPMCVLCFRSVISPTRQPNNGNFTDWLVVLLPGNIWRPCQDRCSTNVLCCFVETPTVIRAKECWPKKWR